MIALEWLGLMTLLVLSIVVLGVALPFTIAEIVFGRKISRSTKVMLLVALMCWALFFYLNPLTIGVSK